MPLPRPRKNESQKDFIGRCMSMIADEYSDQKQRAAVCYSQWSNKKKASKFDIAMKIKESKLISRNSKTKGKTEKRIIVGYAATYDVFKNGETLQITREALENAKDDLLEYNTVLFNHDPDRPIGHIIETATDDNGLMVKFVLSNTETKIWSQVQDGTITKLSFQGEIPFDGYSIIEREGKEPIIQVNVIRLLEAGLVSIPGNVGAETITHYIAESLDFKEMIKESKNSKIISNEDDYFGPEEHSAAEKETSLLETLEEIKESLSENSKACVEELIIKLQFSSSVISELQVLGGKLETEDREVVNKAVEILKSLSMKKTKINEYDLSDESNKRPIFQLNSSIDSTIDFSDEKNTFRKQILKFGKWYHWNAPGGVLKIDESVVDNIVKNFKKKVIENVYVPLTHTDDPSKNTGKVLKLEKTAAGLDAIIEIKEESIAEKIKNGLITCISASIDPNYRDKKNNNFLGTTLLHAALVAEPFIKGMSRFVPLSDDSLADRPILMLEDEEPNLFAILKSINDRLNKIEETVITESSNKKMIKEEEKAEEKIEKEEENEVEEEKEESEDGKEDIEIEEAKKKGKEEYKKCVGEEMKKGKEMEEASKTCKIKIKETFNVDFSDSDLELESTEESEEETEKEDMKKEEKVEIKEENIDFSDIEKKYDEYLKAGKIVPAQKESFINLFKSAKKIQLSDNKVDMSEIIDKFMASQPKIVNFDENGTSNSAPAPKEEVQPDAIPSEVKDFYSKMGLSDESAKESWEVAKKMSEEEKVDRENSLF